MFLRLFLILILVSFSVSGTLAQTTEKEKLEELEQERRLETSKANELEQSRDKIKAEISSLQSDMTRLAAEIRSLQSQENNLKSELNTLQDKYKITQAKILTDREQIAHMLAGLQRIENNPPPSLFLSSKDATQNLRAAKLIDGVNRQLLVRMDKLKSDLSDLSQLQADIERETSALDKTKTETEARKSRLGNVAQEKRKLESSLSADIDASRARANKLAAEADSLKDLIRKLEEEARRAKLQQSNPSSASLSIKDIIPRLKPTPGKGLPLSELEPGTLRFADARGQLQAPVNGRLRKGYSSSHTGYTIAANSASQITAPYQARVEFAGPFKNYDKIVILNLGEGYFMLLTGIGDIQTQTGSFLAIGEPIGLMPFNAQDKTELYIEIRKNGSPVNPSPWLGTAFAR